MSNNNTIAKKSNNSSSKNSKKVTAIPTTPPPTPSVAHQPVAVTETEAQPQVGAATIDKNKTIQDSTGAVDRLGLLKSLAPLVETLGDTVKQQLVDNGAKRVEGAGFVGVISGGSAGYEINVARFFAKCKAKKIPAEKINAVLSVAKTIPFLSEDEIKEISDPTKPSALQLKVDAKKDAPPVTVLEAIDRIAAAKAAGQIAEPPKKEKSSKK